MGAGLVQLAVPRSILANAISVTPELIGLGLDKGAGTAKLLEAADMADAVVIGPGLGQSPAARERLFAIIRLAKPMVVDADGLNMLAERKAWPKSFRAQAVLTPHPGEMKRLARLIGRDEVPSDEPGRIDIATQAARAFGQVIVLKGFHTVITDGQRVHINHTGDSSLSKAGTGDVLSGIIGTFLAEKMTPFDAACAATWIHGKAGELAGQKFTRRCVLARNAIDALPEAIRQYEAATHSP
jgi:NAD(P)H-hydrate epimerase